MINWPKRLIQNNKDWNVIALPEVAVKKLAKTANPKQQGLKRGHVGHMHAQGDGQNG